MYSLSGITNTYATTQIAWKQLLDTAKDLKVTSLHIQLPGWSECESVQNEFNFSDFNNYFKLKSKYPTLGYTLDIGTPVGIMNYDIPSYIESKSFIDSDLISRYLSYVGQALSKFNNPSHIILHTETASTFLNEEDFNDYCDLLRNAISYIRYVLPTVKIGTYCTKNDSPEALSNMNTDTDFLGISYIADKNGDNHLQILEQLIQLAGDKNVAIFEAGIPTNSKSLTALGRQVKFVNTLFDLAEKLGSKLEFISYYQAFDENRKIVATYLPVLFPDWTPQQIKDGVNWFSSLGLKTNNGTPKDAWYTFKRRIVKAGI